MIPRFPLTTVGALVTNPQGLVLIVRTGKWNGAWGVPGGKVEWGETLENSLLREFREEVGLELEQVRFALLQESIDDVQFHHSAHFVLLNYYAFTAESTITPNHEIKEWAWVSPQDAFTYSLNSYTRILVEHYLEDVLIPRSDSHRSP
jgi:nucleoside triphosphatase